MPFARTDDSASLKTSSASLLAMLAVAAVLLALCPTGTRAQQSDAEKPASAAERPSGRRDRGQARISAAKARQSSSGAHRKQSPKSAPPEKEAMPPDADPSPAAPVARPPECPKGNLIAGAVLETSEVRGRKRKVKDGRLAEEGTFWSSTAEALVLTDEESYLKADLGQPRPIRGMVLQGDNNDRYPIEGSLDGVSWEPVWEVPEYMEGFGLRTRYTVFKEPKEVRYLRVRGKAGDVYYSVSELRAYCQLPSPWPPKLRLPPRRYGWSAIDNPIMVAIKGVLAGIASLLFLVGVALDFTNQPRKVNTRRLQLSWAGGIATFKRTRDWLLAILGILAFLSWWNLGHFHFDHYIHIWEHYHYYIGAKYGPELRYSRIYECTAAADLEDGLVKRVKERKMRDLYTNELGNTDAIMADPTRCTRHFTPERWEEFKKDIRYFRGRFSVDRWNQSQNDHGYNATPVWAVVARTLTNIGDIRWRKTQVLDLTFINKAFKAIGIELQVFKRPKHIILDKILALGIVDSLLLIAMWGFALWAFGWRATAVALIWWGCNFPAQYYWNGGAFLRYDWLFWLVVGTCLLKKKKMALGGFALTYATLLRIFPGMAVVALILKALFKMIAERRFCISKAHQRFATGSILALLILIPAGAWATNGLDAWIGFAENSAKHLSTPLTNNMGLKTALGYDHATRAFKMRNDKLEDPFAGWKAKRRYFYQARAPLHYGLIALFLLLLGLAARKNEDWAGAALGTGLIVVAAELTCYYYGFLLTYGFLWHRHKLPGIAATILAALTCLFYDLWNWNDVHFMAMSVAGTVTVFIVTAALALERRPADGPAPHPGATRGPDFPPERRGPIAALKAALARHGK